MTIRKAILALAMGLSIASSIHADDLLRVAVSSDYDAQILRNAGVEPVLVLSDGYLILADRNAAAAIGAHGIKTELVADGITLDQLVIDHRLDRENVKRYQMVFEQDNLRLFRVPSATRATAEAESGIIPLDNSRMTIEYRPSSVLYPGFSLGDINLDSLIGLSSQDSIHNDMMALEGIGNRRVGTPTHDAARDWIAARFRSFGYDSVVLDSFVASGPQQNVVAYKIGSRYPQQQIIIGAHYDAVTGSPGADDNGSGTIGVLEIARVLKNIPTEMTFIFIAFDYEEGGLWGSFHYANAASARGDSIIYMLNMDMIGHLTNDSLARLFYGPQIAYSQLWSKLADSLGAINIIGILAGSSGGSDHVPFIQNGYDATFVHEFIFSTVYHSPRDSSTHINFDYMTRMIKASLATVKVVDLALPPVRVTEVRDVGDGQSLAVNWVPIDPARVDHYWLHYTTVPAAQPESLLINKDSLHYILSGLKEDTTYSFYIVGFDAAGRSSIAINKVTGKPRAIPAQPMVIQARPLRQAIRVNWGPANRELDFHRYQVIRDGVALPDSIFDSVFVDDDPSLDSIMHQYLVRAVDNTGNLSDTAGLTPAVSRAATLQAGRILAVNRSRKGGASTMVNELVTGEFLRQALNGSNFDYYSDTSYSGTKGVKLLNMIDYGMLVIGGETMGSDDIGSDPAVGGILESIAYYLTLGGKVIILGRWGGIYLPPSAGVDTVFFTPGTYNFAYTDYFDLAYRVQPFARLDTSAGNNYLISDFVGAHSQNPNYPDLVWDSLATMNHTNHAVTGAGFAGVSGIPGASYAVLTGKPVDILYTYNSSRDSILTEGQPLAWRSLGGSYEYVYFNIPLSFMERTSAVAALRQAVNDLGIVLAVDETDLPTSLPDRMTLSQNYPNPFNPATTIEFVNGHSRPMAVSLAVFNILGQQVRELLNGPAQPGVNRVIWDGRDESGKAVASGVYFYRLRGQDLTLTRKMVLLK